MMMKKSILLLLLLCFAAMAACAPDVPVNIEAQSPAPEPTQAQFPTPTAPITPLPTASQPNANGENLNANPDEEEYSPDELNGVADPNEQLPSHTSYDDAKAINPDVIGWLTIDDTLIDYPVVRTVDNNYYLGHDVERNKSKYGAVFMDFRNAETYQQRHIILYGHNMKNGTMFHDLNNFKQKDFFDSHKIIKFYWDGVDTEWQVYLAYIIMPNTIYHIHVRFADDQAFADIMNQTIEYAKTVKPMNYDPSVTIGPNDKVLTLSTCTYEYDGSYFAVMAKRIK